MPKRLLYAKIAVNLLVSLAILLLLIFIGPKLISFFLPFFIAFIISSIANPFVRFLEKRVKILRKHGTAIIILLTIIVIIGVLYLIATLLINQIISFVNDIPEIAENLNELLKEISDGLSKIGNRMPVEVQGFALGINQAIGNFLSKLLNGIEMPAIFQTASGYLKAIANGFLLTIVTIIASYFFTIERDKISEMMRKAFPDSFQKGYRLIVNNFKEAVGGYFKAQFKIMFIISFIMWVTFQIMGISYAVLIALGIAFIDVLPVFGTGLFLGPWAVACIISGDYLTAIVLIVLYLVCQFTKQLLQPKMVGDSVGISPLSALIFMFIGYRLYGVLGMIIGIPVGMILNNFYRVGAFDRVIKGFQIISSDINEFRKF